MSSCYARLILNNSPNVCSGSDNIDETQPIVVQIYEHAILIDSEFGVLRHVSWCFHLGTWNATDEVTEDILRFWWRGVVYIAPEVQVPVVIALNC